MKYLPLPEFDTVTSALNFNTPDCIVTGSCDLYTTKSTGADKKLYKSIDRDLSSHQEELLRLGASLSPPESEAIISSSPNLAMMYGTTAFGPLSDVSSRKTFAHLIATLNASHPHYDFSNILRPRDFTIDQNLRQIMNSLNSLLASVAPTFDSHSVGSMTPSWSPACWSLIDKEMRLEECQVFSWRPDTDPFEEDDHPIYSAHYFFFNRTLKRVAYLYVRIVAVIASHSPKISHNVPGISQRCRNSFSISGSFGLDGSLPINGPRKRSSAWSASHSFDVEPDFSDLDLQPVLEDGMDDDGYVWNRGEDGDLLPFSDEEDQDKSFEMGDEDEETDMEIDLRGSFPINYSVARTLTN